MPTNDIQAINPGGSYNIIQTVYQLSRFSNLGDGLTGSASDIQTQLAKLIDGKLSANSQQLGTWTRVWGPCVYQDAASNSNVADNVLYVAYNTQANCYVVAIAGTNGNSNYDAKTLDDNVSTLIAFPFGITPTNSTMPPGAISRGNVSQGAALGTTNLLNLQDTTGSVQSFLNAKASSNATLIFTGHSLGGSLSPTLAYWLYPTAFDTARWGHQVFVLPTAAPATGDQGFVNGFKAIFPPKALSGIANYGFFNQVIWNKFDVVPHSWTNLEKVLPYNAENDVIWKGDDGSFQTLYGEIDDAFAATAIYLFVQSKYNLIPTPNPYVRLPAQMFIPSQPPPPVTDLNSFNNAMAQEHLQAYDSFFGVPSNEKKMKTIVSTPQAAAAAI
ncbi:lipase family protein [Pendulispora albinea]|uniref:Lipase family protein n=1 Tax=Pendulispora albinea TaxID=2741071 RepID=A0ABZ2LWQ9_9BACT